MRKNQIFSSILFIFAIIFSGCDIGNDDQSNDASDSTYTLTLSGSVVDATTGNGIENATIRISDGSSVQGTVTDQSGNYSTTLQSNDDLDLVIIAIKEGYFSDTTSVFAIINTITEIPLFQLNVDENSGETSGSSGGAASINLASQSSIFIGVKETGAIESAEIIFEVRDSSGALIDESNAVELSFSFGATPSGGEYLYPASATTNALGRAGVTLNTGTIAGVVQIFAETTLEGKVIRSKPILISIYGGFPVEDIFYVACEKLNYPALGVVGFSINFTGYAGDKYHNPVRPGTSMYFTTNAGIIDGSNQSDNLGRATVELITEPWPIDPVYGEGFFTVTASTGTEEGTAIFTNTVRLLSGFPGISLDPSSFNIDNGGSQSFTYTLADVNGNPMSESQSVAVKIDSEFYELAGTTEIKFPDTQSKSWTTFSFVVYDTEPDTVNVEQLGIEISTSGPNGDLTVGYTGVGR